MGIIFNRGFLVIPNTIQVNPTVTPTITPTNTSTLTSTPTPTPTITSTSISNSLLMENGEYLLQEDNSKILL